MSTQAENNKETTHPNMINRIINKVLKGDQRSVIVKKNIIYSFGIRGISILVSLMLVPMTLGYVNSELYGVWLTLSSVMVWLGFFDVGFTLGLKNRLAEAIALGEWDKGKALVSTTYFMMLVIFIPLFLILELIIPYINWTSLLNVNPIYNQDIILVTRLLVGFFCLQMIVNVISSVIAAFQKVAIASSFPVIGNILSLIAIWILTKTCPPSLVSLVFAIAAMPVLVLIVSSIILYTNKFRVIAPAVRCINKKYIKDIFSLGAKFFIIQIQILVLYQCTNVLISNLSGPEDVTNYNIAYKYLGISMMAFSIIVSPLWPAFSDAYAKKDFKWMNNIYKKLSLIYFISVIGMILMVIISPFVYNIWIGNKASIPLSMTIMVCIYMVINNWDSLQVNMINGIGAIKLQTYVTMIGLVFHLPLSYILGKYFSLGALGVIISMIIINIIYSTFFTIQIRKILSKKAKGIWIK